MRESSPPCDIEIITKIAIHDYKCQELYWIEQYGDSEALFQKTLVELLYASNPN